MLTAVFHRADARASHHGIKPTCTVLELELGPWAGAADDGTGT